MIDSEINKAIRGMLGWNAIISRAIEQGWILSDYYGAKHKILIAPEDHVSHGMTMQFKRVQYCGEKIVVPSTLREML